MSLLVLRLSRERCEAIAATPTIWLLLRMLHRALQNRLEHTNIRREALA